MQWAPWIGMNALFVRCAVIPTQVAMTVLAWVSELIEDISHAGHDRIHLSTVALRQLSWKATRSTDKQCMRLIPSPAQGQVGFALKARIKVGNQYHLHDLLPHLTVPLKNMLAETHEQPKESEVDRRYPPANKKMHSHASCFTKYSDFLGSHKNKRIRLTVDSHRLDYTSSNF